MQLPHRTCLFERQKGRHPDVAKRRERRCYDDMMAVEMYRIACYGILGPYIECLFSGRRAYANNPAAVGNVKHLFALSRAIPQAYE